MKRLKLVHQEAMLLSKAAANNPLYIAIACAEISLFGQFELVTAEIESYPETSYELCERLLQRLEHVRNARHPRAHELTQRRIRDDSTRGGSQGGAPK